jgi:hypothetical protein
VIEPKHQQVTHDGDPRLVRRHDDHGLLFVHVGIGVGFTHDNMHFAARIRGAGAPPLAAIDDIVVAITPDAGLDVGRIGRRNIRFGH